MVQLQSTVTSSSKRLHFQNQWREHQLSALMTSLTTLSHYLIRHFKMLAFYELLEEK